MSEKGSIKRRNFLKTTMAGAVGLGMAGTNTNVFAEKKVKKENIKETKIKAYRTLGKTGFKVSDISMGYSNNVAVIQAALRSGVNYIDTAEVYRNQPAVGKAIKEGGFDRKKIFITSKLVIDKKKDVSKEAFVKRFNQCLKELQTDYIDCMMIHSAEDVAILNTKGFHEAMDQMKKEKKLKYVGVSNHGSNWYTKPEVPMKTVLTAAAKDGRFDVMLLAYNFIQNGAVELMELCKKKKIGVTLMKVNPVGKYIGIKDRIAKLEKEKKDIPPIFKEGLANFKDKADKAEGFIKKYKLEKPKEINEAAIRFTLDNPNVATVCCAMRSFDHIEDFVKLSGTTLSGVEKKKIAAYKEGPGQLYCRHACGVCESSCSENVPVNTIMRYSHYFDAHGREKYALKQYANLDTNKADKCADCSKGSCETACPYGVPVQGMLNLAHRTLSIG